MQTTTIAIRVPIGLYANYPGVWLFADAKTTELLAVYQVINRYRVVSRDSPKNPNLGRAVQPMARIECEPPGSC
jgi:hypothetical protein